MKRIYLYIMNLILLAGLFSACSEDTLDTFDTNTKAGIYIQRVAVTTIAGVPTQYTDSVSVSFASISGDESKVYIPVKMIGLPVDYDRTFILKVDEEASTAIEGTHFDFDKTKCVILANEVSASVPVTLYRHADLASNAFHIELCLEPNEQFDVDLSSYKNMADWSVKGEMLSGARYKINFSDQYASTMWWSFFGEDYFGTWSASKERRVNAVLGWSHLDWVNFDCPAAHMPYVAKTLRKELQALADAGTPEKDDDGTYMQLSSDYLVDYSAYE